MRVLPVHHKNHGCQKKYMHDHRQYGGTPADCLILSIDVLSHARSRFQ